MVDVTYAPANENVQPRAAPAAGHPEYDNSLDIFVALYQKAKAAGRI